VGPGYEVEAPETQIGVAIHPGNMDMASLKWWERFQQPVLNELIRTAQAQNPRLEAARKRWTESLLMAKQAAGGRMPRLDLSASAVRQERSKNGLVPVIKGNPAFPDRTETLINGGLQLSWELDLFGRITSQVDVAEQGAVMAGLGVEDGWRLIFSEIGRNFEQYHILQNQIRLLDEQIAIAESMLAMDDRRHELGAVPIARVDSDRVYLKRLEAGKPQIEHMRELAVIRLSVLSSMDLELLRKKLSSAQNLEYLAVPFENAEIDTRNLLNRPDVRIARARVDQSLARYQVAVTQLYPRIVLVAGLGLESIESADLFQAASRFWKLGPSLTLPLLNGGQLRSQVKIQAEEVDAVMADFRAVFETAVAEAQGSLDAYDTALRSFNAQNELVESLQRQLKTSECELEAGIISESELMRTRMEWVSTKSELLQNAGSVRIALINLCQAVGGGWSESMALPEN